MEKFELGLLDFEDDPNSGAYLLGDPEQILIIYFDVHDNEWWITRYVKADAGIPAVYKNFNSGLGQEW